MLKQFTDQGKRWLIHIFIFTTILLFVGSNFTDPSESFAQPTKHPEGIIVKPTGKLSINIWVDKSAYRVGEHIQIHFSTNRKAYVYIWDIDPSGVVRLIFPNKFSRNNYLPSGNYTLPDKNYNFLIVPPAGTEYLQAIISMRKLDLTPQEFKQEFPQLSQKPKEFKKEIKRKIEQIVPAANWATDWANFQVMARPGRAPQARFNYSPAQPRVGNQVHFDASPSYDPDGWIKSYKWDFNSDGRTDAYGKKVTHRFYHSGAYQVKLTVIDNRNLSSSTTQKVWVTSKPANRRPIAQFNYTPGHPLVGMIVGLDGSPSYDPDGYITIYEWDFNQDGRFDAYGREVSYSFYRPGSHRITLRVRDNQGGTDSITKQIEVGTQVNRSPVASFTYSPDQPIVGKLVSFDASPSFDPDGWITQYRWDFNQDQVTDAYGKTASYRFYSPNQYKVTLTVVDDRGSSVTTNRWIEVSEPLPPFPQIGDGFWIQSVGQNQLRIVVSGKNWWFKDHAYKIQLETDGRFSDVHRHYPGLTPKGILPVPNQNRLKFSGFVKSDWVDYLITVNHATKIKFNLQMDIDGDGNLEQRTDFVYLGSKLKHPPSNPFVIKFPSDSFASLVSAQICLTLIDQPGFHFMICFNWDEF